MSDPGFTVSVDAVVGMRMLLDSATETHLAARDGEASGSTASMSAVVRPLHAVGQLVAALPSWHQGLDQRWQAHHTALLQVQDEASAALDATLSDYLAQEAALVAYSRGDTATAGPARGSGLAGLVPAGLDELGSGIGGDCDTAATAWRRRRDLAADTADTLAAALKDMGGWTGPAASSFTTWAERHLVERWRDLSAAAEAISRALLDQPAPVPGHEPPDGPPPDPGPVPRVDLPDTPPPSGFGPTAARDDTVTVPDVESPIGVTMSPASSPPDTSPPPGLAPNPAPVPAPRPRPDAPPWSEQGAGGMPLQDAADIPMPRPSTPAAPDARTRDDIGDSGSAVVPPVTAPGPDQAPDLSSSAPIMPSAAVAGAHAIARDSIAHHVIKEISIPPVSSTPAPPSTTPPATDGVLSPSHRWRGPDPGGAVPAGPPGPHGPFGAGRGGTLAALSPVGPGGTPLPWRSRRRADRPTRAQMLVNLAPAAPGGAWVDLAAHRAVGIEGPSATAVARTALHHLHAHSPTHLLVPRTVLDDLTTDDTGTPRFDPARLDNTDDGERVHLVPDPYTGLRYLIDYARHGDDGDGDRGCLLVVPAPISDRGRDHLKAALAELTGPIPAAALLLGVWPGTSIELDAEHIVCRHRYADGANLTGQRLQPTSAEDLAHQLTPVSTTGVEPSVSPSTGAPETDEDQPVTGPATPFVLSVLGPVELRYQPPRPDTEESHNVRRTEQTVRSIPRLARELLAWLAAHPKGATRDQLLATLCPYTTARRRDSNLHAAMSHLRRILTETTGDRDLADLVTTGPHWTLNPDLVTVDVWALLATRNHTDTDPRTRRAELHRVVDDYTGLFASDLSGLWAHAVRENTRRRYLGVLDELVKLELAEGHHRAALDLLERAREQEPLNESVTRAIIKLQLGSNDRDAARSTYEQLRIELAAVDAEPEPSTRRLVASAHQP